MYAKVVNSYFESTYFRKCSTYIKSRGFIVIIIIDKRLNLVYEFSLRIIRKVVRMKTTHSLG